MARSGLEGQTRKRIQTDLDAWHWEDLAFPAGVRMGPFHSTFRARASAAGRFGPAGLEGQLRLGSFRDPTDAVVLTRSGTALAPRFDPDGTFSVRPDSGLPADQYLPGSVLSDRQQRRQDIYRKLLTRPRPPHLDGRDLLLVWTDADEVPFTSGNPARAFGSALLVVPLQIDRPLAGNAVIIPAGFCSFTAVTEGRSHRPTLEGTIASRNRLRFQVPSGVIPFELEKATLIARVRAAGRKLTVSAIVDGRPIVLHEELNPLGTVRVEISQREALRLDPAGGLLVELTLSGRIGPDGRDLPSSSSEPDVKWQIEELGLEVSGRVPGQ